METVFTFLTRSEKVQPGVKLQEGGDFIESKVVKIDKVIENGIYAPETTTGDIVVNNIVAGCSANSDNVFQKVMLDVS